MSGPRDTSRRVEIDRRGVSEVVGVVLLFGLVLAGASLVYLHWQSTQEQLQERRQFEQARTSMQELDGRIGSLSHQGDDETESFAVGPGDVRPMRVRNVDRLTVRLNRDSRCEATIPVTTMTYSPDGGRTITYQAGGLWQNTGGNTTMIQPPSIGFERGTLSVEVSHVPSGTLDNRFRLRKDVAASERDRERIQRELFDNTACYRPDNVTLGLRTDRRGVWADYFDQSMPDGATVTRTASGVEVYVPQRLLAGETNDSANHVVDFTNANPDDGRVTTDGVVVDKGVGNEYDGGLTLLHTDVGETTTVWGQETRWHNYTTREEYWDNETRTRTVTETKTVGGGDLDVALVLDDSGSMEGEKSYQLRKAAKHFVGEMGGGTQVSVVRYDDYVSTPQRLTTDYGAAKAAIDDIRAGGSTNIVDAVGQAHRELNARGKRDHAQVMIFLTDGICNVHDRCSSKSIQRARAAHADGITVHTIGIGSGARRGTLQAMANQGGGEYHHVDDADELDDLFDDLTTITVTHRERYTVSHRECCHTVYHNDSYTVDVVEDRYVVHDPTRLNVSVGGRTRTPWVGAGPPADESINGPDPAPTVTEGFGVADGEAVRMEEMTVWNCARNASTGRAVAAPNQGSLRNSSVLFEHARCLVAGAPKASSDDVELYVDGQSIPPNSTHWYQTPLREAIPPKYANDTDGDGTLDQFALDDNQVVVVYRFDDAGTTDRNNAVFLLELGDAPSKSKADWIVSVRVNDLVVVDG